MEAAAAAGQITALFDFPDEEIAKQLTLMDFRLFANIQPQELMGQAWVSGRAPNVQVYIEHFNHTTQVMTGLILMQPTPDARAYVMERIVHIAAVCASFSIQSHIFHLTG